MVARCCGWWWFEEEGLYLVINCICIWLWTSVETGYTSLLSVFTVFKFWKSWETEDRTAVVVFNGPGNFRSWAVLVQSSLSLFPVLGLDFQALTTTMDGDQAGQWMCHDVQTVTTHVVITVCKFKWAPWVPSLSPLFTWEPRGHVAIGDMAGLLLLTTLPTPGLCPMSPLWASACRVAMGPFI